MHYNVTITERNNILGTNGQPLGDKELALGEEIRTVIKLIEADSPEAAQYKAGYAYKKQWSNSVVTVGIGVPI
jgi:hypothetical protein